MLKINQVLLNWKTGDVHGLSWLRSYGVDRKLAHKYCKSGYLEKLATGVFIKKGEVPNPYGVIKFLQDELKLSLHIASKTSLDLQGHSHYLNMGKKNKIFLVSYQSKVFPSWLKQYSEHFEISFKKSSLLKKEKFLTEHTTKEGHKVIISSRELAILEFIDGSDLSNSLETIENYTESLATLRASFLQQVLEECQSIKVKRVFLYISEKLGLPFFKKIKIENIDLGKGKRSIVQGGILDKKYNITVDKKLENMF